jgi:hypothetical protein
MISEQAARVLDLVNAIETCKRTDDGLWQGVVTRFIYDLGETGNGPALQVIAAALSSCWDHLEDKDFSQDHQMPAGRAVIVVLPRFLDGYIAHWHRSAETAGKDGAVLSATAKGVIVNPGAYLDSVPPEWIAQAREASRLLKDGKTALVKQMATHRYMADFGLGPLAESLR